MPTIVHISDSHSQALLNNITIPECDVLLHTGDIGDKTNLLDIHQFLEWFTAQPARCKIFIGGNHDLCLDSKESLKHKRTGNVYGMLRSYEENAAVKMLIKSYTNIVYLENTAYTFEGLKFWGSPYSPSFNRDSWAFNADPGEEISKIWGCIPNDVNVLLTHTPPYGVLDDLKECAHKDEDVHLGCKDLLNVIKKRLHKLKLHTFGHIHDNYGITLANLSNKRRCLFSNGALVSNRVKQIVTTPIVINI